jgi:hypothetical protein
MSEDPMAPIPDQPGQDPEAAEPGPWTDGYVLSGTLDSGYDVDRSDDARRAASEEASSDEAPSELDG